MASATAPARVEHLRVRHSGSVGERQRPSASRADPPRVLVRALRPKQWLKNLLVVLAPAAAGVLPHAVIFARVGIAFVAFCLLSSATYLINDVRDREEDRRHPRKRKRPVAAGDLSPRRAIRIAIRLVMLGICLCLVVRPLLALVAIAYLIVTTSYSLWWRRIAVIDVLAIATAFLLRAVAGGAAAGVALSRPFLIVASACAMFMVTGKRYAELTAADVRRMHRTTLRRYSARSLSMLLGAAATLGCLAYARWAFARPEAGPWLELSMLPFVGSLGRYALMLRSRRGEAPEDLVVRDVRLLLLGTVWLGLFISGVYGAR